MTAAKVWHLDDLIGDLAKHEPAIAAKVREIGVEAFCELMRRGLDALNIALSKARDTMIAIGVRLASIPNVETWITRCSAADRYAPGQRKKKPRGRRAKQKNRVAWDLFRNLKAAA